ncbi:MAG TPA: hypothetical protein VFN67_06750 [Polyangiales bacterium]|nr:hypothetical protein [Polyangiales bacterium]
MHTRIDMLAALLFSVVAFACGDERESWNGFPLFPPDAGPALSPELESSLRAAEIAFVTQLAAEQAKTAGDTASPNSPDAGAKPPQRMAAEPDARSGDRAKSAAPRRRDAPDAGAAMAGHVASEPAMRPRRPSAPVPSAPMDLGTGGQSGASGGQPTIAAEPDAGVMMAAGAGGASGAQAPSEYPVQPSGPDAGVPDDAADGGI